MIDLSPGTIVDDRYELIEHLGEGGMGKVFKARELQLDRIIALKLLAPELLQDTENRERFKREGKILSRLNHPNILRFYRFGIWHTHFPYIAMEFLQGQSLSSVIHNEERLASDRAIAIGLQICSAMQYAHSEQIVHRDLKPGNIMLGDEPAADSVKMIDFGLAKIPDGDRTNQLTQTGSLIGSLNYMSSEQCLGKKCDSRSDIYSLGCLLYEAVTGQVPLVADNPIGLMHLHATEMPEELNQILDNNLLPAGLNNSLMRAMAKDPAQRYQSMAEFQVDLNLVLSGHGESILEPGQRREELGRPAISRLIKSVCALLFITTFSVGGYMSFRHHSDQRLEVTDDKPKTVLHGLEVHAWGQLMLRGEQALNRGELASARQNFDKALTIGQHQPCLRRISRKCLADTLRREHSRARATELYRQDISESGVQSGDIVDSLYGLAMVYIESGKTAEAEKLLAEANAISSGPLCVESYGPDTADITVQLIKICVRQNRPDDVNGYLKELRKILSSMPFKKSFFKTVVSARNLREVSRESSIPEMTRNLKESALDLLELLQRNPAAHEPEYEIALKRTIIEHYLDYAAEHGMNLLRELSTSTHGKDAAVQWKIAQLLIAAKSHAKACEILNELLVHGNISHDQQLTKSILTAFIEALQQIHSPLARTRGLASLKTWSGTCRDIHQLMEAGDQLALWTIPAAQQAALFIYGRVNVVDAHNVSSRLARARVLDKQRNFVAEANELSHALQHEGSRATCLKLRACCYANLNQYRNAMADINQAILLQPQVDDLYDVRGTIRSRFGYFREAISDYDKAIKIAHDKPWLYVGRASARKETGDIEGALADLYFVRQLKPDSIEALTSLCDLLLEAGKEQAIATLLRDSLATERRSKSLSDECVELTFYGIAMERLQKQQEASATFDRLKELAGRIYDVRLLIDTGEHLAKCQDKQARQTTACLYERAVVLDSHCRARLLLACLARDSGDFRRAADEYTKALRDAPRTECLLGRAMCYANLNSYTEAIRDINEALKLSPKSVGFLKIRGDIHRRFWHLKEAIRDYNEALKIAPKNGDLYCMRGLCRKQEGNKELAFADFTHAIELGSRESICHTGLGDIAYCRRQYPQAISNYKEAIVLNPHDTASYLGLGKAYSLQNEHELALKFLDKSVALAPSDPYILTDRAVARARSGNNKGCENDCKRIEALAPTNIDLKRFCDKTRRRMVKETKE